MNPNRMNAKTQTQRNMPPMMPMGGRPMMAGMGGEKAKNFKGTILKLASYLKIYSLSIFIVVLFAIASTIFAILSPKILGNITNQIVEDYTDMVIYDQLALIPQLNPGDTKEREALESKYTEIISKIPEDRFKRLLSFTSRPTINFDEIGKIIAILIGLYILSATFGYIQNWIMSGVTQKITFNLRKDISKKINKLPLKYYDSRTHGEVLSRITNDVDTVSQNLNQTMTQLITSITTIIGILVMMISISWLMTIVALLILPLSFGLIGFIIKRSQKLFMQQQISVGQLNGHVEEMYSGHVVVKAFNGEEDAINKFQEINKDIYNTGWKSQFFSGLMFPIMNIIGNLGYVGIAVLGGFLAVNGKLNIGDIQAFIQYMQQFTQPIMQTANIANLLQSMAAAAERVFEFLAEEEEIEEAKNPVILKNIKGDISFENIKFGYNSDKYVIKGFNQKVKSGQRIAIVGPTGAGKTTIVNLLMRFYDVNEGSIKIDGVDIRDMRRNDLRKMFAMVLQDTWLFNGTVRDNIAYGKLDATEDEIKSAARAAHVDHFIQSLPGGYNFEINEEADNISQGEKQLLTIARAMLADPPILILDEATSSVDTRTEVLIQKAMDNLMKNRTSFVIAHRLSTIRDADLILVMNEGNIIEKGTHTELLSQKGFYANLYESQFSSSNE